MPDSSITKHLASLPNLSKPALCDLWRQLFKRDPPEIRKDLMLRVIAHRLQEQEFGGLSDAGLFNVGKEARRSVTDESGIVSP